MDWPEVGWSYARPDDPGGLYGWPPWMPLWLKGVNWGVQMVTPLNMKIFEPQNGGLVQMIFLFNWRIFRFHVKFQGCKLKGYQMLGHGMMEILSKLLAASIKTLSWCVGFMWHLMVRSAWCLLWGSRLAWAANKTEEAAKNWGKKHPPGNETNISPPWGSSEHHRLKSAIPGGYFWEVRVFPWRETLQKWNLHWPIHGMFLLSVESSVLECYVLLFVCFQNLDVTRCWNHECCDIDVAIYSLV